MPKIQKLKGVDSSVVNRVADAISEIQACGSCAGIKPEDKHCSACTEEATVAIKAFLKCFKVQIKR